MTLFRRDLLFFIIIGVCICSMSGCAGMNPAGSSRETGQMHYVKTHDNWTIALRRISVAGNAGPPVILCHGLSYNDQFYSLSSEVNLAAYLANRGFDVWVVSLRGSGSSTKWAYKVLEFGVNGYEIYQFADGENWAGVAVNGAALLVSLAKAQFTNLTANPFYANWVLDDYAKADVPAILQYVRKESGNRKVFWVGHSMGGIAMLCYLIKNDDPDIAGLVTVGSQLTMPPGQVLTAYIEQLQYLRLLELAGKDIEARHARKIAQDTANDLFFNPYNRDPEIVSLLHMAGSDTPAVGVLGQYLELIGSGELKTYDNSYNFAHHPQNIRVPYLIMAGSADQLATPDTQQFLYQRVSSTDKTLVMLGSAHGFSVDYGHNDSLISKRAVQEVYPLIVEWLEQRVE